jgi:hypothetical protein
MSDQPGGDAKPEPMPADRLKYLEMVQGVINRMSASSATLKGWTVTLVAALLALAAKDGNPQFLAVALLPTVIFAGLDAYYLHLERGYRSLFDRAANADPGLPLFTLHRAAPDRGVRRWLAALGRPVVWGYYLAVLASLLVTLAVFTFAPAKPAGPQDARPNPVVNPPM